MACNFENKIYSNLILLLPLFLWEPCRLMTVFLISFVYFFLKANVQKLSDATHMKNSDRLCHYIPTGFFFVSNHILSKPNFSLIHSSHLFYISTPHSSFNTIKFSFSFAWFFMPVYPIVAYTFQLTLLFTRARHCLLR